MATKETIFISHANPEDNEFTRWLGAKLSLAGFRVWYDLDRLRGGDVFWDKIERAIRDDSIRFVPVVSVCSHGKDGVKKEWHLAATLEKALPGFVIPIRIDDFKFDDLTILFAGKTVIDFRRNWFQGLTDILQTLEDAKVPRTATPDAAQASLWWKSGIEMPIDFSQGDERIESSWLSFTLPPGLESVSKRNPARKIDSTPENQKIPWAEYEDNVLSFAPPDALRSNFPDEIKNGTSRKLSTDGLISGSVFLREKASADQKASQIRDARNILTFLVDQAWNLAMENAGLRKAILANGELAWFVPKHLIQNDFFDFYDEKHTKHRKKLVGRSEKYRVNWHYGISAKPILGRPTRIELTAHIIFTEDSGELVTPPSRAHRLRRGFCRNWWNARWRDFQRALLRHLSQGKETIRILVGSERYFDVSSMPLIFSAPISLSDESKEVSNEEIAVDKEVKDFEDIEQKEEPGEESDDGEEEL
jgi:TIR domain-containing protein